MLQRMRKAFKNQKGFTLVELIVVIAIIGILAMIAIPRLGTFRKTSKIKADIATAKTIALAVEVELAKGTKADTIEGDADGILGPYMANEEYPTPQYNTTGTFDVAIDGGNDVVTVTVDSVQLYPEITNAATEADNTVGLYEATVTD